MTATSTTNLRKGNIMFTTNVGNTDRIIRVILGIALLAGFFLNPSQSGWHYLYLIGIIPLVTGLVSTCPIYSILGMSTCPLKK